MASRPDPVTAFTDPNIAEVRKIEILNAADPVREADAAFERKDCRFLDTTGYDAIAGVENWNARLKAKYGTRIIGGPFGMVLNDQEQTYKRRRQEFAAEYNRHLLARLGEPGTPMDVAPRTRPERIAALIENLAISQERAGNAIVFTPAGDTPKTDRRMVAYEAVKELHQFGIEAFPALIGSLGDHRQSAPLRAQIPFYVGPACYCIIQDSIEDFPEEYYYNFRDGADGKMHERPSFLDSRDILDWWSARSRRTLVELRIEAIKWTVAEEMKLGFTDAKQKREILDPLEKLLHELAGNGAASP